RVDRQDDLFVEAILTAHRHLPRDVEPGTRDARIGQVELVPAALRSGRRAPHAEEAQHPGHQHDHEQGRCGGPQPRDTLAARNLPDIVEGGLRPAVHFSTLAQEQRADGVYRRGVWAARPWVVAYSTTG